MPQRSLDFLGQDQARRLPRDRPERADRGGELGRGGVAREPGAGAFDEELDRVVDDLGQPAAEQVAQLRGELDVDAGVVQLQREIEERGAGQQPGARVGRLYVTGVLELGQQPGPAALDHRGELVTVDDPGPIVRPGCGQGRVDPQPLRDRARGALALQQVADRDQREPAVAELRDEPEPLDVLVAVHGVAPELGGLREQSLRLVPADGARGQPAALDQLRQGVGPRVGRHRRIQPQVGQRLQ